MKAYLSNKKCKAAATVICTLCAIIFLASSAGIMLCGEFFHGFQKTEQNVRDKAYALAGDSYAAEMLAELSNAKIPSGYDRFLEQYEQYNMEFTVLMSDAQTIDEVDAADSTVLYKSSGFHERDSFGYFRGGPNTYYVFSTDSFLAAIRSDVHAYDDMYSEYSDSDLPDTWSEDAFLESGEKAMQEKEPTRYWVLYSVHSPLDRSVPDLFTQADSFASFIHPLMQLLLPALIISGILGAAAFVWLMLSAGHAQGTNDVRETAVDRIPFELCAGLLFVVFLLALLMLRMLSDGTGYFRDDILCGTALLICIPVILLGIRICMSLAVRLKTKTFWKTTLLYRIFRPLLTLARKGLKEARENAPLSWKAGAVLTAVTLLQLFVLVRFCLPGYMELSLFLFAIYKAVELTAVFWGIFQFTRIRRGTERIVKGDLSAPIPTDGMYFDLKKEADDINCIGESISVAVEARMKSERMKTELITNVSHDIKTPLTSIINYVDLLKKEADGNEKTREYLDVLSRQSDRLRKLLEDLIEASKAATGNLELQMAPCDYSVFLSQILGEYDEKLKSAGITAVTQSAAKDVRLLADGRYLWRIFDNLFSNVCKYALPGTRVYIDQKANENGTVAVEIKNVSRDGLNISPDELMERFVRGDSSRSTEGSGLGLSISRSLMQLMGGDLQLSIDGDLFKVTLVFQRPASDPPSQAE